MDDSQIRAIVDQRLQERGPSAEHERFQLEYEQSNEWERHYSNIRATVSPALASVSVAVLGLSWPETAPKPPGHILFVAGVIWLAAILILWRFTALVVRERWYARLLRTLLLARPRQGEEWDALVERFGENRSYQPTPAMLKRPAHRWIRDSFGEGAFLIGFLLTIVYYGWLLNLSGLRLCG